MNKVVLQLDYGTLVLYDLESTWIQPKTMSPGWMLCYSDAKFERGIIYRTRSYSEKEVLLRLQEKLMNEISEGKKLIKL